MTRSTKRSRELAAEATDEQIREGDNDKHVPWFSPCKEKKSALVSIMKNSGQQHKTTTGLSTKSRIDAGLSCNKSEASIAKAPKQRSKRKGKNSPSLVSEQSEEMKTSSRIVGQGSLAELPRPSSLSNGKNRRVLSPSFPMVAMGLQAQITENNMQKAALGFLMPAPEPSIKKIKLQLFPIDEVNQRILEKEKHNPYLELTIGIQKRISSVLKHLNTKWGDAKAVSGELMLFPDNARPENLTGHRRWTSKDSDTRAADVYAAVGSPAIFRLRYGWFSTLEPKVSDNLQAEENQVMTRRGEKDHPCTEPNQELDPFSVNIPSNQGESTPVILDTSVQASNKDNPTKCDGPSLSWLDGLSNISFGALLSGASPAPDASRGQPLYIQNNTSLQAIENFDSFDAAVAGLIARNQVSNISTQAPYSTIWNGEETCHAFPLRKMSSLSQKDIVASSDAAPLASSLGPHATAKLGSQVGDVCLAPKADLHPSRKDGAIEESKDDLPNNQAEASSLNGGNHFGLMDLNWPDSIDTSEFVPSSRPTLGSSDSINFSGLIAGSL